MDRINIRLNSQTSKSKVNVDEYIKLDVMSDKKLLPPDAIDKIISANDVFNSERQNSPYYRFIGTINPMISNPLFNLSDSNNLDLYTWAGFNYFDSNGYRFNSDIYPSNVKTYLKEKDGWFGYFDPNIEKSGLCNYFDMEPKRQRFSFVPDNTPYQGNFGNLTYNWEVTITYPASSDTGHTMVNGGLLLADVQQSVISTRNMTAFGVPCMHNLSVGDTVLITGASGNIDGQYPVIRTGLDNGEYQDYYFVIDVPFNQFYLTNNTRMVKYINDVPSSYYFRKFRKINVRGNRMINSGDVDLYKLGFSENIYVDSLTQLAFNSDINVSGLTDNLGRPLSEVYLSIIKKDSNGLFTKVSSGIETPFIANLNTSSNPTYQYLQNIPAISKIHNGGNLPFPSHIPLESDVMFSYNLNNDIYGDLVEYNTTLLTESVLADVHHRFNTRNRETSGSILNYIIVDANPLTNTQAYSASTSLGPRQEGYYYKAHNLIKIRNFSNYIDTGDSNTYGIPSYAYQTPDGTYTWRQLLDIGFNETNVAPLDYPFLNGCHYMYANYCFLLKRQDPFDFWNLYYSKYPADPIGAEITSKFNTYTTPNVC